MPVPLFDLTRQYQPLAADLEAAALRVLRSGRYILGEEVRALEAELGRSLLAHGAFLAEIGQFEEARARLEEARTLFTRLRMKDCLQRTERVLDAL